MEVIWKGKRGQTKQDSAVFGVEKGQNVSKTRIEFKESKRANQNKRAPRSALSIVE